MIFSHLTLKHNSYHGTLIHCIDLFLCLNADLSGTRGGIIGGVMLVPASEIRGGLGGGWTLSDMS